MANSLTESLARESQPREAKYTLTAGEGLMLLVMPSGAKYSRLRYYVAGKQQMIAVGKPYPKTDLATARQLAHEMRAQIAKGIDPAALRRIEKVLQREVAATAARQAVIDLVARKHQYSETEDWQTTEPPPVHGGCRCGAIRYRLNLDYLPAAYACHCTDCQTWTGSAFSEQVVVTEESLEVDGTPMCFVFQTPSGRESRQWGCTQCFTRLYNRTSARPGMIIVRAGTLDRSAELMVAAHIWTRSCQAWLKLPSVVPSWPEAAPLDQLDEALASCLG